MLSQHFIQFEELFQVEIALIEFGVEEFIPVEFLHETIDNVLTRGDVCVINTNCRSL